MKRLLLFLSLFFSYALSFSQVTITDDGSQIKIVNGSNTVRVPKDGLRLSIDGEYIFIGSLKYKYTDISSPSSSSISDLAETIDDYIENVESGSSLPDNNLKSSLDGGLTTSILIQGNSTVSGTTTWPKALYDLITAEYPGHDACYLVWNANNQTYDIPVFTVGSASGRYASFSTQGLSLPSATIGNITADIDLRARIRCTDYSTGSTQAIVGKYISSGTNATARLSFNGTGNMVLITSPDGTSASQIQSISTVTLESVVSAGIDIWVRGTMDVNNGASGKTAAFYYSTNEGSTWTQLGANVTTAGTTSIYTSGTNAWEVGCTASTTAIFGGRIYRVVIMDGIAGTILSPFSLEAWTRIGFGVTFVGPPLFTMFIGGQSGATISFLQDATRIKAMIPFNPHAAIFLTSSHNDGTTTGTTYQALQDSWLTALRARCPLGDVFWVNENPQNGTNIEREHAIRCSQSLQWATKNNLIPIDLFSEFKNVPTWTTTLMNVDGIHPATPAGYNFEARKMFIKLFR